MWRESWTPQKWNRVKPCILWESLETKKWMCKLSMSTAVKQFLWRRTLIILASSFSSLFGSCRILVLPLARIRQEFFCCVFGQTQSCSTPLLDSYHVMVSEKCMRGISCSRAPNQQNRQKWLESEKNKFKVSQQPFVNRNFLEGFSHCSRS